MCPLPASASPSASCHCHRSSASCRLPVSRLRGTCPGRPLALSTGLGDVCAAASSPGRSRSYGREPLVGATACSCPSEVSGWFPVRTLTNKADVSIRMCVSMGTCVFTLLGPFLGVAVPVSGCLVPGEDPPRVSRVAAWPAFPRGNSRFRLPL